METWIPARPSSEQLRRIDMLYELLDTPIPPPDVNQSLDELLLRWLETFMAEANQRGTF